MGELTGHSPLHEQGTEKESKIQVREKIERASKRTGMHLFGTQGNSQPDPASQKPLTKGGSQSR